MEYEVHYLIFGGAFWAFTLFGLALHAADIQRRAKLRQIPLEQYRKSRPLEWLLSSLLLFACAAAGMGGAIVWGMQQGNIDVAARFMVMVAAALIAVALAYAGMMGKSWVHWSRDEFLTLPGATSPAEGQVMVNAAMEAERENGLIRRVAWPVYLVGSTPLLLIGVRVITTTPFVFLGILLMLMAGAAVTLLVLSSAAPPEAEDEW